MLLCIGHIETRGCCGRDRMVVGFTTTYAISACKPLMLWVWILLRQGVFDTTLCDKVCQWLVAGRLVVFFGYPGFLHQSNWKCVKNNNTNSYRNVIKKMLLCIGHIDNLLISIYNLYCFIQLTGPHKYFTVPGEVVSHFCMYFHQEKYNIY